MAIAFSQLDEHGQTTVPAEICQKLGIGPGSLLEWEVEGTSVMVRRAGPYTSKDIRRALFDEAPEPRTLEELQRARGRRPR